MADANVPARPAELAATLQRVRVVLVETSHPGNVGSVARAMKTMGLQDLVLVQPRDAAVCRNAEAVALASGAADLLQDARVAGTLAQAIADCHHAIALTSRRRELSHGMHALRAAVQMAAQELAADRSRRIALVFGSETYGLSNDQIDLCQAIATIPTSPDYASLNLSHAVQLAAYEMRLALDDSEPESSALRDAATIGDVEGFFAHLQASAVESGFLDPASPKRFMTRMRRLFTRARLEREEVAILRGLLGALDKRRR
ncbi:MAG TPA: RNA methyltransferase [Usitatibacteraceae bacterium]|nr:RNA methyltransferase [Usitatibacteraceae bacterium]